VAIEFKKLAGSAFFFREQVEWLKDQLSDYNDAVYTNEIATDEPVAVAE
jgi:hypothetical protein